MIRFLLLHSNSNCLSVQSVDRFKLLQSVSVSGFRCRPSALDRSQNYRFCSQCWCSPPPEAADIWRAAESAVAAAHCACEVLKQLLQLAALVSCSVPLFTVIWVGSRQLKSRQTQLLQLRIEHAQSRIYCHRRSNRQLSRQTQLLQLRIEHVQRCRVYCHRRSSIQLRRRISCCRCALSMRSGAAFTVTDGAADSWEGESAVAAAHCACAVPNLLSPKEQQTAEEHNQLLQLRTENAQRCRVTLILLAEAHVSVPGKEPNYVRNK